jgi:hypothetical protein
MANQVDAEQGSLAGLGFAEPETRSKSSLSSADVDDEHYAIELATPVDVSERSQRASSPFMNLVDPSLVGSARLSGSTDPRVVLGDRRVEEEIAARETLDSELSELFSGSPGKSSSVDENDDSADVDGQMNWGNGILKSEGKSECLDIP